MKRGSPMRQRLAAIGLAGFVFLAALAFKKI